MRSNSNSNKEDAVSPLIQKSNRITSIPKYGRTSVESGISIESNDTVLSSIYNTNTNNNNSNDNNDNNNNNNNNSNNNNNNNNNNNIDNNNNNIDGKKKLSIKNIEEGNDPNPDPGPNPNPNPNKKASLKPKAGLSKSARHQLPENCPNLKKTLTGFSAKTKGYSMMNDNNTGNTSNR